MKITGIIFLVKKSSYSDFSILNISSLCVDFFTLANTTIAKIINAKANKIKINAIYIYNIRYYFFAFLSQYLQVKQANPNLNV